MRKKVVFYANVAFLRQKSAIYVFKSKILTLKENGHMDFVDWF